jgi:hypothetical protein
LIEDRPKQLALSTPRTVLEVAVGALRLLARRPVLFLTLALAVIAPYELLVLAITGAAPLGQQSTRASTAFTLLLIDFAFVGPLISALFVHAVVKIGQGVRPELLDVARRGLTVLPVVAAAQIVAGLGIALGLLAFILPGVLLALGWAVVAQAAAIERPDWIGALRRSRQLTRGLYPHVLGVVLIAGLVGYLLTGAGSAAAGTTRHAWAVVLGIAVITLTRAFTSLTSALLYFDLVARAQAPPAAEEA